MKYCHDCGIEEGQIHQLGCDMERCPFCGGQLIVCGCAYKLLNIDCSPNTWAYSHGLTKEQEQQWLQLLNQKGRIPYIIYPNICARCGKLWPDMFMVSDEEWKKYIQPDMRGKIICKSCLNKIKKLINSANSKKVKIK